MQTIDFSALSGLLATSPLSLLKRLPGWLEPSDLIPSSLARLQFSCYFLRWSDLRTPRIWSVYLVGYSTLPLWSTSKIDFESTLEQHCWLTAWLLCDNTFWSLVPLIDVGANFIFGLLVIKNFKSEICLKVLLSNSIHKAALAWHDRFFS